MGREPPSGRCRTRWTPDRWRYEQATVGPSWVGPDPEWMTGFSTTVRVGTQQSKPPWKQTGCCASAERCDPPKP